VDHCPPSRPLAWRWRYPDEVILSFGSLETITRGARPSSSGIHLGARGVVGDISLLLGGAVLALSGVVTLPVRMGGVNGVVFLDLGPFRDMPRGLNGRSGRGECGSALSDLGGSWAEFVAAVRVSMGGGRIGAATSDEVVDDVVAVEQEDDVEAFRVMAGIEPDGRRGKGGWGEGVEAGVGRGEGCIVVAMSRSDYKVNPTFSTTESCFRGGA